MAYRGGITRRDLAIARALGLTIPERLLVFATEAIE
jgi:hypothetical protein